MGGKRRSASKSFFSILLKLFQRPHHEAYEVEQPRHGGRRVRASDEDGEPDIDRKAKEFIAKFHETRLSDLQAKFHETRLSDLQAKFHETRLSDLQTVESG